MFKKPKIGVVLGSGSARGWAHIGVLKALQEENIPIDMVVGTSIGALVGAVYIAGALKELEEIASNLDWKQTALYFDLVFPKSGLIDGKKIEGFVKTFVRDIEINELGIPFAAVAADLFTGQEIVIKEGKVIHAVRASISLPGIFTPVKYNKMFLIDGGTVNPVPVSVAKQMGADIVIAVNLNTNRLRVTKDHPSKIQLTKNKSKTPSLMNQKMGNILNSKYIDKRLAQFLKKNIEKGKNIVEEKMRIFEQKKKTRSPNFMTVLFNSINIMQEEITKSKLEKEKVDLLITPKLGHIKLLEFQRAKECIKEGERATREALNKIQRKL